MSSMTITSYVVHKLGDFAEEWIWTTILAQLVALSPLFFGNAVSLFLLKTFLRPQIKKQIDLGEHEVIDIFIGNAVNKQKELFDGAVNAHEAAKISGDENAKLKAKNDLLNAARNFGKFVQP